MSKKSLGAEFRASRPNFIDMKSDFNTYCCSCPHSRTARILRQRERQNLHTRASMHNANCVSMSFMQPLAHKMYMGSPALSVGCIGESLYPCPHKRVPIVEAHYPTINVNYNVVCISSDNTILNMSRKSSWLCTRVGYAPVARCASRRKNVINF